MAGIGLRNFEVRAIALLLALAVAWPPAVAQTAHPSGDRPANVAGNKPSAPSRPRGSSAAQSKRRRKALHAIMERIGVGPGSVVADLGAGNGRDSWVFAEIVGEAGTVYSEEITESKVQAIRREAEKRELGQVRIVLGQPDDPRLPQGTLDAAYMHYVYHHVTKPRAMLRAIWRSLKPGGYFVVVDRHRGTLRDWVPREERGPKHYWIAETTVVREAREEGFAFVECAEDCWPHEDQFVLVFQRPRGPTEPGHDPDPFLPLGLGQLERALLPGDQPYRRPVFIALGQARQVIAPIMQHAAGPGVDVVLEEWATQKEERPPAVPGVSLASTLTENGDPHLTGDPVDVVFFLDAYHLLFHQQTLLSKLREHLTPNGRVYVMDRRADKAWSRRESSHRRKIAPAVVKVEMERAGFDLAFEGPAPAADRFLLVFGKRDETHVRSVGTAHAPK